MTPEMWLDLEPILHRVSRKLPKIARIPRGFSTMLPCSLLGSTPTKLLSAIVGVMVDAMWGGLEIKPHLGGHAANTQPSAVRPIKPSNALASTMLSAAPSRFVTIWAGRTRQAQADPTTPTWHAWTTA